MKASKNGRSGVQVKRWTNADGTVRERSYVRKPQNQKATAGYPPGSLGALILEHHASREFQKWKPNTKDQRVRYLRVFDAAAMRAPTRDLTAEDIEALRDEVNAHGLQGGPKRRHRFSTYPGAANSVLATVSALYKWALRSKRAKYYGIVHNPAAYIEKLEVGEVKPWTPEQVKIALTRNPEHKASTRNR